MTELRPADAVSIAPALRTLLKKEGCVCTVAFRPDAAPKGVEIEGTDLEAVYSQLSRQIPGTRPQEVTVKGVGVFEVQYADPARQKGRLDGKIVIVTGAAGGFGKEIADLMTREGAYTVYADRDGEGAEKASRRINEALGRNAAVSVSVDVGNEARVEGMIRAAVLAYGGVDVFISNAGIARAGDLDEMTVEAFERMANVNYTAYFLCVKYAQKVMKLQHRFDETASYDIIQINSKSGLEGSNKNFAYSGSKFGGIGLTKSFALELCPYRIKVNAVCPGNYLDGPLWSDPETGLFVQFLKAGKVPGAETVEDVRKFYEAKVPMGRGCLPVDVVRAVLYCIEQDYETGQAIPVTGGQIMLH